MLCKEILKGVCSRFCDVPSAFSRVPSVCLVELSIIFLKVFAASTEFSPCSLPMISSLLCHNVFCTLHVKLHTVLYSCL